MKKLIMLVLLSLSVTANASYYFGSTLRGGEDFKGYSLLVGKSMGPLGMDLVYKSTFPENGKRISTIGTGLRAIFPFIHLKSGVQFNSVKDSIFNTRREGYYGGGLEIPVIVDLIYGTIEMTKSESCGEGEIGLIIYTGALERMFR